MAEIATIARPYAEALFDVGGDRGPIGEQLQALAAVAGDAALRQFAANPKVDAGLVFNVVSDVLGRRGVVLLPALQNLLRALLDNRRLAAVGEIADQYHALVNATSGVSDAVIHSAFPIGDAQLAEVAATLEQRFARKLNPRVEIDPELIGGIRVVVGDEVLDTSVKARLQQMKAALTA
jgi:F-type H+-transporting ATPase subunit delta